MTKNIIIVVLLLALAVLAYLLATKSGSDVQIDTRRADSLQRALNESYRVRDSLTATARRDRAVFAARDSANQAATRVATTARNKAVGELRQFMAANPVPKRDSLTEAALQADSVQLAAVTAERDTLRQRVDRVTHAYDQLAGNAYVAAKIHAKLIAEKDGTIAGLVTDAARTARENQRLKALAIGGSVLGVAGILLAL